MGLASNPTLLLWFKSVEAGTRRAFARLSHTKTHRVLLVDTVLAVYVLLQESERLRTCKGRPKSAAGAGRKVRHLTCG